MPSEVQEQLESFTELGEIKQDREEAAQAKAAEKEAAEEAERQKQQQMLDAWNDVINNPQDMYGIGLEGIDLNDVAIKENKSSVPVLKQAEELQLDINKK